MMIIRPAVLLSDSVLNVGTKLTESCWNERCYLILVIIALKFGNAHLENGSTKRIVLVNSLTVKKSLIN